MQKIWFDLKITTIST